MIEKRAMSNGKHLASAEPVKADTHADIAFYRFRALRRQPTQQRGALRIRDVLDATERLLQRQHFDLITIEDIAIEARIQIGSLYHFFESKTSVLVSVLERQLRAEANMFRFSPEDGSRSLEEYLKGLEERLHAHWGPRLALLDLYFAYQRHHLIRTSVLELRAQVARDIRTKIRQLFPQLSTSEGTAVGEQIGIILAVLNDNLFSVGARARRRLTRESLDMLVAYVHAKAAHAGERR